MRGIGFEFGAIRGAVLFDFLGFFLGEFRFRGSLIFRSVQLGVFLRFFFLGELGSRSGVNFFGFVLLEFGAAGEGIGFGMLGNFFVLCFGQLGSEGSSLVIAQFDFAADRFSESRRRAFWYLGFTLRG